MKTHFTVVTIYDQSTVKGGKLGFQEILSYFDKVMAGLPIFRRKVCGVPFNLDAPYLVDDPDFHIESHIKHIALPAPKDWRQFCILCAQIQATPIDNSKPMWDMHVIEGLDNCDDLPKGCFAILTRMQHSLADGDTVRGLLAALHQPAGVSYEPPANYEAQPEPSLLTMSRRAMVNNFKQGWKTEASFLRKVPMLGKSLGKLAVNRIESLFEDAEIDEQVAVPKTLFNGPMEYRRVFQARAFDLDAIKGMRVLAENSTVNDVVLTLVGGALRRYLESQNAPPSDHLFAMCPVNMREDKFSNSSSFGNNISLMRACMFTEESDPAVRMKLVAEETRESKKIQRANSTKEMLAISENIPNVLVAAGARALLPFALSKFESSPIANAVVSNVPGPQQPLYFLGAEMLIFTGVGPLVPGMGLLVASTSYNGRLTIGVSACPSWVSDPQQLAQCLQESFDELCAASLARRQQATTGRAKAKS